MRVDLVARLLGEVDDINRARRDRVVNLARDAVGGSLAGKRVAVLGVAFKPNSDDIRDSPSLDVCGRLIEQGAIVSVHDPVAMPNDARIRPELRYVPTVSEAAEGRNSFCISRSGPITELLIRPHLLRSLPSRS